MTKTRQNNDVINLIGVIYAENDIKLSWLIKSGVNYDKNK